MGKDKIMRYSKAAAYFENGIGNFILFTSALQSISEWFCHGGTVDLILRKDFKDSRVKDIKDIAHNLPIIENVIDFPSDQFQPKQYKFRFRSTHGGGGMSIPQFNSNKICQIQWTMLQLHETEFYNYELFTNGYRGGIPAPIFPSSGNTIKMDPEKIHIALCNGTFKTRHWLKKQWPEGHWKDLIAELTKRGYICWWVGGDTDKELGIKLIPNERMLAGKLSVIETGGFIQDCALSISTDTALAHVAAALDLDQIVLWGGTLLSKNRPLNKNGALKIARAHGISCSPCMGSERFNTCRNFRCMQLIDPTLICDMATEILKKRGRI